MSSFWTERGFGVLTLSIGVMAMVNALPDSWLVEKFSDRLPHPQPQGKFERLFTSDRQYYHQTGK